MNKSPISILQERFVTQQPVYTFGGSSTNNQYTFKCTVMVGNVQADGYAFTKKEAKQKAAEEALILLGSQNNTTKHNMPAFNDSANYISLLNEHSMKNRLTAPLYNEKPNINGKFTIECCYGGRTVAGEGSNKKIAKQQAAKLIYERLDSIVKPTQLSDDWKHSLITDEQSTEKVLNKYSEIQTKEEMKSQVEYLDYYLPKLQIEVNEVDVLEKLSRYGHKYNPIVIKGSNPCMLALQLGARGTSVGVGKTREAAEKDLLEMTDLLVFSDIDNNNTIKNL